MGKLADMKCEACRSDSPPVGAEQSREWLEKIRDWTMHEEDGIDRLTREFAFQDFAGALKFVNRVGLLAEKENHHPRIVLEWGKVTVSWWTHVIGGLHRNDFILAARTDTLYRSDK